MFREGPFPGVLVSFTAWAPASPFQEAARPPHPPLATPRCRHWVDAVDQEPHSAVRPDRSLPHTVLFSQSVLIRRRGD